MICLEGATTSSGESCTREPGQRAIVVSNVPTYSYGPGALTHTALDATTFEALMLRHDVDLVISGALGYNGLYYTLAPGIHEPCPDGEYPRRPPQGSTPECTGATLSGPASSEALPEPATLISDQNLSGAYPTLIAAGAGGKFGPDGLQASDGGAGQWHGYSVARFLSGGELAIEQRPILDWIGLDAANHAVRARARLTLHGYGRSPISTPVKGGAGRAFHYELTTPSITHRYDLLLADPERPWLPCAGDDAACEALARNLSTPTFEASPGTEGADPGVESCGPYVCLPSRIGTVDDQSGQVTAGDGKYPETLAVATLSVGDRVATYPLVFKRSPSFVAKAAARLPATPTTSGVRTPPPPPGPPPPEVPTIPKVEVPQIPAPPPIPSLTAAQPPELTPPTPPAPPPPSQQPAPLDLSVAPPGVSISTPTALIQPPTPPVNPAPPGGARREARQRQAAAQKGGADSGAEQSDGGDLADGPPEPKGTAMTRLDHSFTASRRGRPEPSFTAYRPSANDSPLGPAALYTGALTLLAFALATGWRHGRPTPRRHQPEIPVPAWSRTGHRRR
jgi:hypothetical protein